MHESPSSKSWVWIPTSPYKMNQLFDFKKKAKVLKKNPKRFPTLSFWPKKNERKRVKMTQKKTIRAKMTKSNKQQGLTWDFCPRRTSIAMISKIHELCRLRNPIVFHFYLFTKSIKNLKLTLTHHNFFLPFCNKL